MPTLQNPPVQGAMEATEFNAVRTSGTPYDGSVGHTAISKNAGSAFLTKASAGVNYTLAAPIPVVDDGLELTIISATAFAHVVTVGALKVNGVANGVMTWAAAIGNSIDLVAFNGTWYTKGGSLGVVIS